MISTAVAAGPASVAQLTGPHNPRRRRAEGAKAAAGGRGTNSRHRGGDPRAPKARGGSAAVLRWLTSALSHTILELGVPFFRRDRRTAVSCARFAGLPDTLRDVCASPTTQRSVPF